MDRRHAADNRGELADVSDLRDQLRQDLKRQVRKWLDARGYKGKERSLWWAELRRVAKDKHGIDL
jgi:hypothetical protein